jgi:hypothetical protein
MRRVHGELVLRSAAAPGPDHNSGRAGYRLARQLDHARHRPAVRAQRVLIGLGCSTSLPSCRRGRRAIRGGHTVDGRGDSAPAAGRFAAAAVLSVPLVDPVVADEWETWAWLGGSIVGSAPLLVRRWVAALAAVATLAVVVGVGWWTGGSPGDYGIITVSVGLMVGACSGLPTWLWICWPGPHTPVTGHGAQLSGRGAHQARRRDPDGAIRTAHDNGWL